jgi:hypothetical protein
MLNDPGAATGIATPSADRVRSSTLVRTQPCIKNARSIKQYRPGDSKVVKVTSFTFRALERITASEPRYPITIGRTMIYGLDRLEPVALPERTDLFVDRWRTAMSFQLGAEEFEKFCIGRRKMGSDNGFDGQV